MHRIRLAIYFAIHTAVLLACGKDPSEAKPSSDNNKSGTEAIVIKTEYVWVYIDNGALQCENPAKALSETAKLLKLANIAVNDSKCGAITGSMTMTLCGTKDLNIHLHQVPKSSLSKAESQGFTSVNNIGHSGNKSFAFTGCP